MGNVPMPTGIVGSPVWMNAHEFRGFGISRLHTHANAGFDVECTKFWCGQVKEIDKLKYDKFWADTG
jgi:hypothetical protein